MVIVLDKSDRIVRWNSEAGERFRLAADPAANLDEVSRYCWPTLEDRHTAYAEVQVRGVWSGECALRIGGREVRIEMVLSSLRDADGELAGKVMVLRDVTERTHAKTGRTGVTDSPDSHSRWGDSGEEQISICAECKSMRDGMNDWQQADAYLSQRFKTSFAYMMCPECVRRLYPQLDQAASPSVE